MVSLQEVDDQLKKLGYSFRYWGRNEIKELCRVLTEDEQITHCVNGHYQGGFAMLVTTDKRLLLIDRKPMYLTIEAIWYDKIGQIDFNHRLLNATISISTPNKQLDFMTWNNSALHKLLVYTQGMMANAKENTQTQPVNSIPEPVYSQPAQSQPQPSLVQEDKPHIQIPNMPHIPSPYEQTLYAATRLPFSRRRYYSTSQY